MKLLGALLGAIISPLLLVTLVYAVYPKVEGTNYDSGTPAMTLLAGTLALIGGAVGGALIAGALKAGHPKVAIALVMAMLVAISAFPIWLATIWYLPPAEIVPRKLSQRAKWASEKQAFWAQHGFEEQTGLSLAGDVRDALDKGKFPSYKWQRYEGDEEAFATIVPAYRNEDDGWRYALVADSLGRAMVFLDPRLDRPSPVFEVNRFHVYRRETRDGPGFSTDARLAASLAVPGCIARFARTARAAGTWDGNADTLPVAMADRWSTPDGCPVVHVTKRRLLAGQEWVFEANGDDLQWLRFVIHPAPNGTDTPFEFAFRHSGINFLRGANGTWHMRAGYNELATVNDPPPPPCFFDLKIPCELPPLPPR